MATTLSLSALQDNSFIIMVSMMSDVFKPNECLPVKKFHLHYTHFGFSVCSCLKNIRRHHWQIMWVIHLIWQPCKKSTIQCSIYYMPSRILVLHARTGLNHVLTLTRQWILLLSWFLSQFWLTLTAAENKYFILSIVTEYGFLSSN